MRLPLLFIHSALVAILLPSDGTVAAQEASAPPAVIQPEVTGPTTLLPNPEEPIIIQRMGLPDQFERMHEVAFPTSKPVVVTLGDRDGSAMLNAWVDAISVTHGETVNYLGMADLGDVPKSVRPIVRRAIKKETPNFPVLLDWNGDVSAFLRAKPGVGNVFVIDHTGKVLAHFAGRVNASDMQVLSAYIEAAIENVPVAPGPGPTAPTPVN